MFNVHLRLIGNRVIDFLRTFSLDITADELRANIDMEIAVFEGGWSL